MLPTCTFVLEQCRVFAPRKAGGTWANLHKRPRSPVVSGAPFMPTERALYSQCWAVARGPSVRESRQRPTETPPSIREMARHCGLFLNRGLGWAGLGLEELGEEHARAPLKGAVPQHLAARWVRTLVV